MSSFDEWLHDNFVKVESKYRSKDNFKYGDIYFIKSDFYTVVTLEQIYNNEMIHLKRKYSCCWKLFD